MSTHNEKSPVPVKFKVLLGPYAMCVEGGQGPGGEQMPDTVDLTLREINGRGELAKELCRVPYVHRSQIASVGLSFLDVATHMAAEATWLRSDVVGRPAQSQVIPLSVAEQGRVGEYLMESRGQPMLAAAVVLERLRKRIPILQSMQQILERVDDDTANQLALLLTLIEQGHSIPPASLLSAEAGDSSGWVQ